MSDKDVKLIIRAKNEASKEIKTISDAMKVLAKETDSASASSNKSSALFGKLSGEIKKFNAQTQAFEALGKVSAIMEKAGAAADALRANVVQLETELNKSKNTTSESAARTDELKSSLEALRKTYADQRNAASEARKETLRDADAKKVLSAANKDLARANALAEKNPEKQTRVQTAVAAQAGAQDAVNKNAAAYEVLKAAAKDTQQQIKDLDAAVTESERGLRANQAEVQKYETALATAGAEITRVEQVLGEMAAESRVAAESLKLVANAEHAGAEGAKALAPQIERMGKALAGLQRYSNGNGQFVDPKTAAAFQKQRAEIEKTEITWRELEATARDMAVALKASTAPTDEQVAAFKDVTGAARAAKNEYNAQIAVLASLQGTATSTFAAFKAATAPLKDLTENYEKNKQAIADLTGAMGRYISASGIVTNADQTAAMGRQSQALDTAQRRYTLLTAEVERLGSVMASGKGTEEEANQLRLVSLAANQAQSELKQTAVALKNLESSAGGGGSFFTRMNEGGRESLSLYQRLRGEVLSLTASFVGFFGAIQGFKGVIDSTQQLEAAQNQLGVVFSNNTQQVSNEIGFLQRNAQRLGISFGVLSDEYGKFAIAAKSANVNGADTRKIFLSLAEAGRVNKLSMDDMQGIFLALTQSMSKAKFSAEEVRGQLGERLPGAFNILADALGVSTSELDDMMKKGDALANNENLLKFAAELDKRFGSSLANSLSSTSANLGRFFDNLFNAQVRFGQGGFMDAFNAGLEQMNKWFASREGRDFFLSLGAAAGHLADGLAAIPAHLSQVLFAVKAIVAIKFASWMTGLLGNMVQAVIRAKEWAASNVALGASTFTLKGAMESLRASTVGLAAGVVGLATGSRSAATGLTLTGVAATGARGAMNLAAVAARTLWVAVGGWIGIIATGLSLFATSIAGDWLGGIDEATSALDEHNRIMQIITTEYDKVTGSAKDWGKILKDLTLDELTASARTMQKTVDDTKDKIRALDQSPLRTLLGGWGDVYDKVVQLRQAFVDGKISAGELTKSVEAIYSNTSNDAARQYLESLLKLSREEEKNQTALDEAADAVEKKRIALLGLRGALGTGPLDKFAEAAKGNAKALADAAEAAEKYKTAIDGIKGMIPELADELKQLKDQGKLDDFVKGLGIGPHTQEQQSLIDRAQQNINVEAIDTTPLQNNIDMTSEAFQDYWKSIKGQANFMTKSGGIAKWGNPSTSSWQSTNLTAIESQSGHKALVNKASAAAFQGFLNELEAQGYKVKSLGGFNFRNKVGGKTLSEHAFGNAIDINPDTNKFSKELITDMPAMISQIAAKFGISSGGDWKNKKDAMHFEWTGTKAPGAFSASKDQLAMQKDQTKELQKQNDERDKARESTAKEISDSKFELDQQLLKNQGKEREAAMNAAERELKGKDKNATNDEIAQVRQLAAARYDAGKALTVEEQKKKTIADANNAINALEEKRNGLLEQRKYYEEQGNTEKVQETNAALIGVNSELTSAIDNAIKYQQALGGPQADAAIAKLNNMKLTIAQTNLEGKKFAMTATEMSDSISGSLESGIISMFDTFAQAIANGENAIGALWTAFRQFAANFLLEIAKMILKQVLFNSLQTVGKALGGGIFGFTALHSGGVVGASGVGSGSRSIAPGWFNNAVRYHTGGVAGLKPDEVPAVLKQGEEVLTENDARHRNNLKGGGKGSQKIVNMFDSGSFLSEALNSEVGTEVILNHVRANPSAWKQAINQ